MKYMNCFLSVLLMIWMAGAQTASTADLTCRNSTCECESDGKTCKKPAPKPVARKKAVELLNGNYRCEWSNGECKLIWAGPIQGDTFERLHPPLDVPAIQLAEQFQQPSETGKYFIQGFRTACIISGEHWDELKGCGDNGRWTCKEKSRILEHDEATPPKYWCHRVQP